MSRGDLADLKAMNKSYQLSEDQQRHNVNVAYESYARARRIRDKAVKYQITRDRWDERFYQSERRKWIERLRTLIGVWEPERPEKYRWLGWEETKERRIDADRYGILVNCEVDWSTDTVDNPSFSNRSLSTS
jgi:hypothetical protein